VARSLEVKAVPLFRAGVSRSAQPRNLEGCAAVAKGDLDFDSTLFNKIPAIFFF
jgi:hypothetical protein